MHDTVTEIFHLNNVIYILKEMEISVLTPSNAFLLYSGILAFVPQRKYIAHLGRLAFHGTKLPISLDVKSTT